jgi:hypothetical protein
LAGKRGYWPPSNLKCMKKCFCSFLLVATFSISVFAWGPTGHRATGLVATRYLNQKARKALEKILQGQTLAIASTWMDEVRSDSTFNYMEDWHWVTIPHGQTYDQSELNIKGDIIASIERVINDLKTKKLDNAVQARYIRILIHLIGDIHQPLHVGALNDRGGNDVKVMWFRNESNLHRVWDSDMIDDSKLSYTELALSLDTPTKDQIKSWQKSTVREWAIESQSFEKQVYDIGNGRLSYRYSYLNFPVVRQRLLQAGVRLAGVLNDIYGK